MNWPAVGNHSPLQSARTWLARNQLLWRRWLIITAVFFLTILITYIFPRNLQMLLILLPFGIAGILILLRWPPVGLFLLIYVSMMVPVVVPAVGITMAAILGLTGLWIFDMLARERRVVIVRSYTITPLVMLVAIAIISFFVGFLPWYPITGAPFRAQIGGLFIFVVVVCAYLLVAHHIKNIRWLKALVFFFIGIGALYIFGRLVPPARPVLRIFDDGSTGSIFWIWMVSLSLSQGLYNQELKRWQRGLLLGITAAAFVVCFGLMLGWMSGWGPSLVAVLIVLWVGWPRLALIVSTVGGASALLLLPQILQRVIYVGDNAYSQVTRLAAWSIVGEIVKVNPILGLGPANYSWYTPLFPIMGVWYVRFNSHNNYVDLVAQVGLLGLLAFLWFAWEVGKLGWSLRSSLPKGGFARAYTYGALGGLIATLVTAMLGDWVIPYVYNIGVNGLRSGILSWLFLGGLVVLDQLYIVQPQGEAHTSD